MGSPARFATPTTQSVQRSSISRVWTLSLALARWCRFPQLAVLRSVSYTGQRKRGALMLAASGKRTRRVVEWNVAQLLRPC